MNLILRIDYVEYVPDSYRAVRINRMSGGLRDGARFATGDAEADFMAALAWAWTRYPTLDILFSSTADSFVMDVDGYEFYQHPDLGMALLRHEDRSRASEPPINPVDVEHLSLGRVLATSEGDYTLVVPGVGSFRGLSAAQVRGLIAGSRGDGEQGGVKRGKGESWE